MLAHGKCMCYSVIMQKYTEAKKKANQKWDKDNIDRISVALPKGYKDRIKVASENSGESVNKYIKKAIDNRLDLKN